MGIENLYTSTYNTKNIEQTKRYNRKIMFMLRCYAYDHQWDWDRYIGVLN